ncbi:helix-turn-helix transcriptional regulator [Spirillospora sp. NPDC048911]|uniref:helix-turn-helix transcriptional regulator n=1 Tax=Spirillospora sp. NPDC048911 TaxID=3364527 RepID=UPI00371E06CB
MTTMRRPRLAKRRKTQGFTQESLAAALGSDRSTVARWERGQCDPQAYHRAKLCRLLELSPDELDEVLTEQTTGAQTDSTALIGRAVTTGAVSGPMITLDGGSDELEDLNRRTLLGLLAATAVVVPLGRDFEPVRAALTGTVIDEVRENDADLWERVAFDYAHEVGHLSTAGILPELLTDIVELNMLVSRARSDAIKRRLIRTAAHLAALTAIALTNVGDPRSARRWWRTATSSADASGDPETRSLVRGRQAVFSLYEERPTLTILKVAEQAIEIGGNAPIPGVVSGQAARAQALARLGRHQEARKVLEDLEGLFERLPVQVQDDRVSQWGWSEHRLQHVASNVHTFAGNIKLATRAQARALDLYPHTHWQGRTQVELHRAGCLLRAGDIDEGGRHMVRVLERLPTELGNDALLRRTALTSLAMVPEATVGRSAVQEAYQLLTVTGRQ